ncbi:unnamed protein product, partial [Iphiclides podalirius]
MVTALLAPQKVAGMIIVDVSPASSPNKFNDVSLNIMKSMSALSFKGDKKLEEAKRRAKKHLKVTVSDDVTMDLVLSNLILKSDHTIGWSCNIEVLLKYFDVIASFPRLKRKKYFGPTFFIGGQLSECLPPSDINGIKVLFPNANLKYVSGAGFIVRSQYGRSNCHGTVTVMCYESVNFYIEK